MSSRWKGVRERGATAVEYGLLVGLLAVGIIGSVTILQDKIATTLKEGAPFVHQFTPGSFSGYMNTPSSAGGAVILKTAILKSSGCCPGGYVTGVGVLVLPTIVRSGQLQWAVAACSPNGVDVLHFGVECGIGYVPNNLTQNIAIGSTYGWTKTSPVWVPRNVEKPNAYLVILPAGGASQSTLLADGLNLNSGGSEVANREIRVKDLVVGDPTAVSQWIQDHPYSGAC